MASFSSSYWGPFRIQSRESSVFLLAGWLASTLLAPAAVASEEEGIINITVHSHSQSFSSCLAALLCERTDGRRLGRPLSHAAGRAKFCPSPPSISVFFAANATCWSGKIPVASPQLRASATIALLACNGQHGSSCARPLRSINSNK